MHFLWVHVLTALCLLVFRKIRKFLEAILALAPWWYTWPHGDPATSKPIHVILSWANRSIVHQKQGTFFTRIYSWAIAYKDWCPRSWHWPVLSQSLHGAPIARNFLHVALALANRFMVHQKQGIKQGVFFTLTYPWPIAHMDWCPTCWQWLVLSQSLHGAPAVVKMPQPCLLCSALGECTLLHHLCHFFSCWRGFCVGLKTTYNKVSVFYTWLTVVRSIASTHGWCICTGFVWTNE